MVKDLVCGMEVDHQFSRAQSLYRGRRHHIRGSGCQSAFERSPERYLCAAAPSERLRSDFTPLVDWAERLHEPCDRQAGERAFDDGQSARCGSELWLG
ncbi:MAG: hypothetical protein ACYC5M_15745 [Anaerolineae bacterium]